MANLGNRQICKARFQRNSHIVTKKAGTRNASNVSVYISCDRLGQLGEKNDIADRKPSVRLEHTMNLAKHSGLIRAEIDHAVADHEVDRTILHWKLLDVAFAKLHI